MFDMFDNQYYINWTLPRLDALTKNIKVEYFKDKTLLELGCGYANIGNLMSSLGSKVTCSDGRKEYLDFANQKYPNIKTLLIDCDNNNYLYENYDIILHWGLLNHLKEIEIHLEKISQKCNVLLLETQVCDSDDDQFYIQTNENKYDEALNHVGIRPSPNYVEAILKKNGFEFKVIKDPKLNSDFHKYDWEITKTKAYNNGLSRYWICWKNINSPLNIE